MLRKNKVLKKNVFYKKMGIFNIKSIGVRLLITVFFFILPLTAANAASVDFNTMMKAVKGNVEHFIVLTKSVAYVLGIWFMYSAIQELKKIGQSQSATTTTTLGGPLMRLAIGTALLYFPSTVDIAVSTLWGGDSPQLLEYTASIDDPFGSLKEGIFIIAKAVGYVSFIKGFVILSHSTDQGAQQGTAGKGIAHIIGGILAINIMATINIISSSLGIS